MMRQDEVIITMLKMNDTTTAQLLQPLDYSHYYSGGGGVGNNDDDNDDYYSYSPTSTSASSSTTTTSRRHYYRSLATLRMPSDGNYSDDNAMEDTNMDWYSYTPSSIVATMHSTPRFGHSNRLGIIAASSNAAMDYAQGIKQFTLFYLLVPLIVWTTSLLLLKCVYGVGRVGCAAGGEVLDMYLLSKQGISRKERTRRMHRSWKVQSVFLIASMSIPAVSVVMMSSIGLAGMTLSVDELQSFLGDVDTLAYKGKTAVDGLQSLQESIVAENNNSNGDYTNPLIQGFLEVTSNINNDNPTTTNTAATTLSTTTSYTQQSDVEEQEIDSFLQKHHFAEGEKVQSQQQQQHAVTSQSSSLFIETWCPGIATATSTEESSSTTTITTEHDVFWEAMTTIDQNAQSILQVFGSGTNNGNDPLQQSNSLLLQASSYFETVIDTAAHMNSALSWFMDNDWLLKFLVMLLNVVNLLLLLNVYLLSKNNIIHRPTRCYVASLLVPAFCFLTFLVAVVTMVTGMAAQVNADFCNGGESGSSSTSTGSVKGTLQDGILAIRQNGDLDTSRYDNPVLNRTVATWQEASLYHPLDLAYAAMEYYATGCLSENPILFLEAISWHMTGTVAQVQQLTSVLLLPQGSTNNGTSVNIVADTLNEACGQDMSFLVPALEDLNDKLSRLQTFVGQLTDTASCAQISPLLQRLSHGAMCDEAPYSLTVLWSCGLVLVVLCMIMLTTRAALYNSVRRKKPRDKKPRRVVEKEFGDYQDFMGQYYQDTQQWKLDDPLPQYAIPVVEKKKATQICLEFDDGDCLKIQPTFETVPCSTPTSSEEDNENFEGDDDDDALAKKQRAAAAATDRLEAASDIGGIYSKSVDISRLWEDDSYGSEYDSEISDEDVEKENEDGDLLYDDDDEQSAMMSFISETRSIAMQTLHSLQRLKPMLASIHPMLASTRQDDDDIDNDCNDDDFFFQDQNIGHNAAAGSARGGLYGDPPSVCDDSLYLATPSMCKPPSSPGLHPVIPKSSMLSSNGNKKSRDKEYCEYDSSSCSTHSPSYSNNMGYANAYFKKQDRLPKARISSSTTITAARIDDGVLKEKSTKNRWIGRSVRHRPSKQKDTNVERKSSTTTVGRHSKQQEHDDRPRLLEIMAQATPSSIISALTPSAPNKPFSFLYRTKNTKEKEVFHDMDEHGVAVFEDKDDEDAVGGDCDMTTPHRRSDNLSLFSLSPGVASIRPTKLEMSPLLTPVRVVEDLQQQQQQRHDQERQQRHHSRNLHPYLRPSIRSRPRRDSIRPRTVATTLTPPKQGHPNGSAKTNDHDGSNNSNNTVQRISNNSNDRSEAYLRAETNTRRGCRHTENGRQERTTTTTTPAYNDTGCRTSVQELVRRFDPPPQQQQQQHLPTRASSSARSSSISREGVVGSSVRHRNHRISKSNFKPKEWTSSSSL